MEKRPPFHIKESTFICKKGTAFLSKCMRSPLKLPRAGPPGSQPRLFDPGNLLREEAPSNKETISCEKADFLDKGPVGPFDKNMV